MNSLTLPRWFGRRKRKGKGSKNPKELNNQEQQRSVSSLRLDEAVKLEQKDQLIPQIPTHSTSLMSLTASEEVTYVNGRAAQGEFREYFLPPSASVAGGQSETDSLCRSSVTRCSSHSKGPAPQPPTPHQIVEARMNLRRVIPSTDEGDDDSVFLPEATVSLSPAPSKFQSRRPPTGGPHQGAIPPPPPPPPPPPLRFSEPMYINAPTRNHFSYSLLIDEHSSPGNHYGTPKPSAEPSSSLSPLRPASSDVNFPGAHPSSEGKRRRNRSNVEAMTAKHDNEKDTSELMHNTNGTSPDTPSGSTSTTKSGASGDRNAADSGHPESPDVPDDCDSLGPLPPNWEKAYTDKGEPYFIDHNSGTSHWLDPRLSRVQKKRPEECDENELPFGWERIDDPHYGTYYIDHVNRRTQYENPVLVAKAANHSSDALLPPGTYAPPMQAPPPGGGTFPRANAKKSQSPFFTRDPHQLKGERLRTQLVKSSRGLGFTIVGGDDNVEEFLQIKSVVPNGPAWIDGKLRTGDVLVYVNDTCVLGFTHHDMVTMFQSISSGEVVMLEVCRGYPLPFDPEDPNTEIVTTVAVTSPEQGEWAHELERARGGVNADVQSMPDLHQPQPPPQSHFRPGSADLLASDFHDQSSEFEMKNIMQEDQMSIPITKGGMGFGFTIADSAFGQKVKKILDRPRCKNLNEGDILMAINNVNVRNMSHNDVVQVLKECPRGQEASIVIQRPPQQTSPSKSKYKKSKEDGGLKPKSGFLFRSKTPTADFTQEKETVPNRPKTPLILNRSKTPTSLGQPQQSAVLTSPFQRNDISRASVGGSSNAYNPPATAGYGTNAMNHLTEQMHAVNFNGGDGGRYNDPRSQYEQYGGGYNMEGYNGYPEYPDYGQQQQPSPGKYGVQQQQQQQGYYPSTYDPGYGYTGSRIPTSPGSNGPPPVVYRSGSLPRGARKESTSFEHSEPLPSNLTRWPRPERRPTDFMEMSVTLSRHDNGFGFRIVGGTEEGSQVSIGHIVPGGAADLDGRLFSGDEIVAVDGLSVLNTSHHQVVSLMGQAAQGGRVTLAIRRRIYQPDPGRGGSAETYPYDVTVSRRENEGFGFVIISSVSRAGSTIGRIIPGSPAERCGRLHVGDRILAVNHVDINNMHHGEIVNLIKDSGYSVVLTVGPPIASGDDVQRLRIFINLGEMTCTVRPLEDDTSSNASTSHRSSTSSMVTAQAYPTVLPPADSAGSTVSVASNQQHATDPRSVSAAYQSYPPSRAPPTSEAYPPPRALPTSARQTPMHLNYTTNHYKGLTVAQSVDNYQQEDQELNMLELDDQYYAVELSRGARGFGFSIRGGREFHSMPLFVLRIAVDGPAAADGRLRVGDQIIEINGINTKNMTHAEAIELIKSGGNSVRLLVRRGKMPPAALMEQVGLSPLSPTPVSSARPMSAMSQPTTTMMPPDGNYGNYGNGYSNGYNGSYIPNGHPNGPVTHSSPRGPNPYGAPYYYQQQQYQQ